MLGFAYTLDPRDTSRPPLMTGHALDEGNARFTVERLMQTDDSIFRGIVRDLGGVESAAQCRRSRDEGKFVWLPLY